MRSPLQVILPIYGADGSRIGFRIATVTHPARIPTKAPFSFTTVRGGTLYTRYRHRYTFPVK